MYKTIYDIEQVLIPSLQRSLEAEREADSPSEVTIFNLQSAIEGWQDVIDYNDEIHANAELAAEVGVEAGSEEPADLDFDSVPAGGGGKRISWSGGGQAYSFSSTSSSSTSRSFSRSVSIDSSLEAGFEIGMGLLGFTASVSGSLTASFDFDVGEDESSSVSSSTESGFTLSDPELGDYFVTEVLTDSVYGTPLFRTLSGASRCIWEPGTVRREQIGFEFADTGGTHLELNNLAPDEAAVVTVRVCNNSPEEGTFDYKLNMKHSSNPDALEIYSLGEPITEPRDYLLPPGCTNIVLEVERGPIAYAYDKVTLRMVVPCESGFWNGNGMARMFDHKDITFTMNYLMPCPRVVFAGATAEDEVFVLNIGDTGGAAEEVMLVVQNDLYFELKWVDAERLENVILQYRKSARDDEIQKQQAWVTGDVVFKHSDGMVVDYDEHDEYGFVRLFWDVSSVPDGKWEVRVVTACTASGPATKEFDSSSTMVLPGLIDRVAPTVLSGFSEPVDSVWEIGDDISVLLRENIDWSRGYVVSGEVVGGDYPLTGDMLDTLAVGRLMMVAFGVKADVGKIIGKKVELTLDHYFDFAGNKNEAPYLWEFDVKLLEGGDVSSRVAGVLLTEGGEECVGSRQSGACKGFDALFRAEVSTLLEVGTGRIVDTSYSEVEFVMNNSSSVARGIEVGFTIAPGTVEGDIAAWELSAKFVGGVRDKELMEDYSALANVYFREAKGEWGNGEEVGWRNENGGIHSELIELVEEGGKGGGALVGKIGGLSKKNLFVAGMSICVVMTLVAGAYIVMKRTAHRRHKRKHEIEDLEAELEADAAMSGVLEDIDVKIMTPEDIRKLTKVRRITHGQGSIGGKSFGGQSHGAGESTGDSCDNPMYSQDAIRRMTSAKSVNFAVEEKEEEEEKGGVLGKARGFLVSMGLSRPAKGIGSKDAHHDKSLQLKSLDSYNKRASHSALQDRARKRQSVHNQKHLKKAPLPPGSLPEGVDQFFNAEGAPYYFHEESGKVVWSLEEVQAIVKERGGGNVWEGEGRDSGRGERVDDHAHESILPTGVKVYETEGGDEYYYCVKSGRTVWDVKDIKEGVDTGG